MALEGNLKDFSLVEMFRLLDSGAKSGALHASGPSGEGIVCFSSGRIYFASAASNHEPAGKRLVGAGVISEKQLRQAQGLMKIQKRDKADRKLGQILVDEGYLEADVLEGLIADQIVEALFELMRWDEGELRFEPDDACPDADLGIALPVEQLVADAEKRLEAWERIREKIPSMDARFAMSADPGHKPIDIHLKPREWMLLCYLHGGRSVRELVELAGYGDFETAKVLYGMFVGGLIERAGAASGRSAG